MERDSNRQWEGMLSLTRNERKHRAESLCEQIGRHVAIPLFRPAVCLPNPLTGLKYQNSFLSRNNLIMPCAGAFFPALHRT